MATYPLFSPGYDVRESDRLRQAGDRVGYYRYLQANGSIYAPLALGVVARDAPSGSVAIAYCCEYARRHGVIVTDDTLVQINLGLIRHDCQARLDAFKDTGINRELPMTTIRSYHAQVFRDTLGTSPETWTAEVPLQCAGSKADDVWIRMLTGSFIEVAIATCMEVIRTLPGDLQPSAYACMAAGWAWGAATLTHGQGVLGYRMPLGVPESQLPPLTPLQRRVVDYLDILTCSGPIAAGAIALAGYHGLDEWVRSETDVFGRSRFGQAYLRGLEMQSPYGYSFGP
jgi:hypothetical protein